MRVFPPYFVGFGLGADLASASMVSYSVAVRRQHLRPCPSITRPWLPRMLCAHGPRRRQRTRKTIAPVFGVLKDITMGFLGASCTFTRFRIVDQVPADLWPTVMDKLRQFNFRDIDDIPDERAFGWTSFEDMLDTSWRSAPPEKAAYLAFALRLDTRRIPPAVLKKHTQVALREEEKRIKEQGKKFIARERKTELREQVRLRLMQRFLPIPAVFEVIWATDAQKIYLGSNNTKIIDMFMEHFTLTFDLHLEPLTPYALATSMLEEEDMQRLDDLEATKFV